MTYTWGSKQTFEESQRTQCHSILFHFTNAPSLCLPPTTGILTHSLCPLHTWPLVLLLRKALCV